jgi:hypothetical protein
VFDYYREALSFIHGMVHALAWPIVVYLIARMFREQISAMVHSLAERIATLSEWRGFGTRAVFGGTIRDMDHARVEASSGPKIEC